MAKADNGIATIQDFYQRLDAALTLLESLTERIEKIATVHETRRSFLGGHRGG